MKTRLALTLALVAGTTAAMAAPRESVTFTDITSNGRLGTPFNAPDQTWAVTGSDAGGPYTAQFLNVSGTLTSGFVTEAQIQVTPPTGTPFIVTVFTGGTSPVSGSRIAIPVDAFTTAGNWTFRFFESFDDGFTSTGTATGNNVDGTWNTITFTLDDAAPSIPAVSGAGITFTGVDSDGTALAPGATRTWVNAAALPAIPALRVRGAITGMNVDSTQQVTNYWGGWRIRVTPPNGAAAIIVAPGATQGSTQLVDLAATIPNTVNPVGTWTFDFFEATGTTGTGSGTTADTPGVVDARWNQIGFELIDRTPSGVVAVAADNTGTWASASGSIASAGGVQWFTFTAPATLTATGFLDIDTTGTNLSPVNDTDIAMYLANGNLVDSDEDDAANLLSQLSYGTGNRQRVGNGSNFSGQDGTIAAASTTGINPGGVYFVAVAGGNAATHASVFNTGGGANTGPVTLRVRAIDSGATIETPSATVINVTNDGVWNSGSANINSAGEIAWFTFTAPASLTATGFLDIDTIGTSLTPANDCDMGLYLATGALVDSDEDDSTDSLSQLSYGQGSRFRPGNGVNFGGQDGAIAAASTTGISPGGVYFLAVSGGNITTHGATFNPSGTALNTGTVTARIRAFDSGPVIETPTATTITVTNDGAWNSGTSTIATAGSIAWFTFTTPADLTATGAVDIDFTGTSLTAANDTDAGIYTAAGVLVDSDEDDGTDLLSQFSYGAAGVRRNPTGNGVAFRGQDGTVAGGTGNLAAATQYFIGVGGGNLTTHASTFNPSGTGVNTGSVTARVRAWSSDAPSEPATPPASTDLGRIGTTPIGTDGVITRNVAVTGPGQLNWFRFVTGADATTAGTNYLDIDTEGTQPSQTTTANGTLQDTEIGVFTAAGALVDSDDDSGSNQRSLLSFGSSVSRPAVVTPGSTAGLARTGQDTPVGGLLAGTYYIAVGNFDTVFVAGFEVTTTNTAATAGDIVLNFRTNLPGGCGPSDVSSAGQVVGADGELTADDIIVFIGWFFAADARADIAGAGQTVGADGQFTADDIILFINRFFAGC